MDHTIALIRQSHDGDEKAREQLVEENIGLIWCIVQDVVQSHRRVEIRGFDQ